MLGLLLYLWKRRIWENKKITMKEKNNDNSRMKYWMKLRLGSKCFDW